MLVSSGDGRIARQINEILRRLNGRLHIDVDRNDGRVIRFLLIFAQGRQSGVDTFMVAVRHGLIRATSRGRGSVRGRGLEQGLPLVSAARRTDAGSVVGMRTSRHASPHRVSDDVNVLGKV